MNAFNQSRNHINTHPQHPTMKNHTTTLRTLLAAACLLSPLAAIAQVPQMLNYQGRVASGDPPVNFDGTGQFKFALVDGGTNTASQATGKATLSGQFVTDAFVTNGGSGYTSVPSVTLSGGGGSGAEAIATVTDGVVTDITMTNAGSNYTSPPAINIAPPPPSIEYQTYWSNDGTASGEPAAAVTLPVTKGLYSVLLGDTSLANMAAIPNSVFTNPDVRLRVSFNDGTHGFQQLSPDSRIAAVGYAMMAETVPDGSISAEKIAEGAVGSAQMAGGAITSDKIAGGAITSDKLASNITVSGSFVAASLQGDGAGLTNIPASAVVTAPPGMVRIPAGPFTMGDTLDGSSNAIPVTANLSAFYMAVHEVTLSQWQAVYFWAKDNGYTDLAAGAGKSANHPVQTVNWYDVVKWCNARSEMEGLTPVYYTNTARTAIYRTGSVTITNAMVKWDANGYRLPTEAEWEKAARGGLAGQRFPWGNTITQNLANYRGATGSYLYDQGPNDYNALGNDGTFPYTTPVGTFAANAYGLHDMAGNVWEWCWDWYDTPYAEGTDPRGPDSGTLRVYRGGSWYYYAIFTRVSFRFGNVPDYRINDVGFRPARTPSPPPTNFDPGFDPPPPPP